MIERELPPGLVMWPAGTRPKNRLCVLISDIHCTDCTVGNQTASETDWQLVFKQMEFAVCTRNCRWCRRRGIGRALFIFDLAKLAQHAPGDTCRFYARDMTSWGDRMDSW